MRGRRERAAADCSRGWAGRLYGWERGGRQIGKGSLEAWPPIEEMNIAAHSVYLLLLVVDVEGGLVSARERVGLGQETEKQTGVRIFHTIQSSAMPSAVLHLSFLSGR